MEPGVLCGDVDFLDMSVLFTADNVDHNIITIDSKGAFHGMSVIAAVTPGKQTHRLIPRRQISELKTKNKTKNSYLRVQVCKACFSWGSLRGPPEISWQWQQGRYSVGSHPWQGMMHVLHQGNQHPGQSSVKFLPMINMYSGDKSCIVFTQDLCCNLAMKHNLPTIVTFHQPLYWKAAEIIIDAPEMVTGKVLFWCWGFSIHSWTCWEPLGILVEGTGLKIILETVYGENAVVYMMTGKLLMGLCVAILLLTSVYVATL